MIQILLLVVLPIALVPFTGLAENRIARDAHGQFKSITVVMDDDYPPYIFKDKGKFQGILVDEWALWEKKTGIKVILKPMDWNKAQQFIREGKADVIDTIFFNESRALHYDFSKPYATINVPVFFRKNISGIVDIDSLHGFTIGVKKGDACIDVLKKKGITSLKEYDSYYSIIQAALNGRIKVFCVDKPPALYYLYKLDKEGEFRYSLDLYTGKFHRAVKKGRLGLLRVVENGFAMISNQKLDAIKDKWIGEPLPILRPENFRKILFGIFLTGLVFLVLMIFNIVLRKRVRVKTAELEETLAQLKESEEKHRFLSAVTENISNSIIATNTSFEIIYINIQTSILFGYTLEDLKGKPLEFLSAEPMAEHIKKEIYDTVSSGKIFFGESMDRRKNGSTFECEYKVMPLIGEEGKPYAYVSLHRDITQRNLDMKEKIEAQRKASEHEKYALVGRIAGKMAHDFNNILGAVMGNSELALMDCRDMQIRKILKMIYEQTIRGKNLTMNLVAFSKDQEVKQDFFNIDEKVDLVLNLMKKDLEDVNVVKKYSRDIPEMFADPGMIEHAIMNMIQNSIHATSLVESPEIVVSSYIKDECICLEIKDNGCGIPSEHLSDVYKPSFTLKDGSVRDGMYGPGIKGTGYGMANVKKYVDLHKGKISIQSEFKKGTKIILSFPITRKRLTQDEIAEVKHEYFCHGKNILIVEDEKAISDVQSYILTHQPCDHKVDTAVNGNMAMDLLNKNRYDLISLDYFLPNEINGLDLYHYIRKTNPTVPVLLISGNLGFIESVTELKQQDPYIDYLSKPCRNVDYINCINRLLIDFMARLPLDAAEKGTV